MNNKLAFTTTSLARPEILDQTYKSFTTKLQGINFEETTLFINIDPLPSKDRAEDTMLVASKYFGEVYANMPDEPNFTKAVDWCWTMAKDYPFIFHLEDDWILDVPVQLDVAVMELSRDPEKIQCILRAYPYAYKKAALSPSVMKNTLFSSFAGSFDYKINPEVQLRNKDILPITQANVAVLGVSPIVRDIGREWLKDKGMVKPEKGKFVRY